ncbi:ATP-binding protein [Ascidiaceihabitans sp.]|uniref:ATP-binding protein n=1 Tax=Ascidiaceihabitans sp. TaxID=1872644 RepID=UPI003298241D
MTGFFSVGGRSSSALGRRMVIYILLANAFLSLFASSVQLYASYKQGRAQVTATVQMIENNFKHGFEEALWRYNSPLIEALLEGVLHNEDVQYLKLQSDNGQIWEAGEFTGVDRTVSGTVDFFHDADTTREVPLGKLFVGVSLQSVETRLWSQLLVMLFSNLGKTLCASMVMLLLFDRIVTRHLETISQHVSQRGWFDRRDPLRLDRAPHETQDDLDNIAAAINEAHRKGRQDFDALQTEVHRRRVVETLLRQRSQALENANEEQAQFTYAISHDMKSPANTIQMLLKELLETEADNLSEDGKSMIADACLTVQRMTLLVEDVLNYARTVGDDLQVEDVDLNVLLAEIVQDLTGDIAQSNGIVEIGDLPRLQGSPWQLRLLFQNLVQNGLKFAKPGVTPHVTIREVLPKKRDQIRICVQDNGIGVDQIHHEKIFALFQRLHTHTEHPGSGLGLTVCKRVTANHGGTISMKSQSGDGCAMTVEFPAEGR